MQRDSQAIGHTCIALICFSSSVPLGMKQEWILCSEHGLTAYGLCYLDVESFTERCVMSVGSCSEGSCEDRQGTSRSWSLFASHQIWQPSLLFWSSGPNSWGDDDVCVCVFKFLTFIYLMIIIICSKFLFPPSIVTASFKSQWCPRWCLVFHLNWIYQDA